MKALITGAYGFVGKHLARSLVDAGYTVIATGRNISNTSGFTPDVKHSLLDTLDTNSVATAFKLHQPDVIYQLAGVSFVPDAEKNFAGALAINAGGLHNVLQGCVDFLPQVRCVVISSPEIYKTPDAHELPLLETQAYEARNKYGLTRIGGESVSSYFMDKIKGGLVIARPFTHIGPGQEEKFAVASFAKQIANIKAGKHEAKILVGNLDVERDFSDVGDIIRAYVALATKGQGAYNLGSGKATRVRDVLTTLLEIAGLQDEVKIEVDPSRVRPNEMPAFYGSCEKAFRDLGWKAEIPLSVTLENVYKEWLEKSQLIA